MIVSRLSAPQTSARLKKALQLFAEIYADDLVPGKYPLEGEDFFTVKDNVTKPSVECSFETHKDYADVQIVIHGGEIMAYRQLRAGEEPAKYPGGDCWLFDDDACDEICLTDGMFAVFFPGELHKPNIQLGDDNKNRKVIMKLKGFTAE